MIKRIQPLVALVLAMVIVVGCGKAPEKKIIGTWYPMANTGTVQFFEDGTISITNRGNNVAGKYSLLDEENLQLDFGVVGVLAGQAGPQVSRFEFDGSILRLYDTDGSFDEYSQSKETAMKSINAIRSQVDSGLNLAASAKAGIAEYYTDKKYFPASNSDAGIGDPATFAIGTVSSLEIKNNGKITVTFGGEAVPAIAGKTVIWTPSWRGGSVSWSCRGGTLDKEFRPEGCQ